MALLPITLGIGRLSANPRFAENEKNAQEIRSKILERDDHTCRFCGFQSKKYQEVVHISGYTDDYSPENMATGCIFCHQCFDLEKTAQMNSGVLVWLPELTQAELNHTARAIYVARISQGTMAEAARKALDAIMVRREDAKARLSTDDPSFLAIVMRDFISSKNYAERHKKLDGLRLWPLDRRNISEGDLKFNQFPQILAYWRSKDGPFGGMPPVNWKTFYAKIREAA